MGQEFADFIKRDGEIKLQKKDGLDFYKPDPNEHVREAIDFVKPPMTSVFPPEQIHTEHIPDRPSLPSLAEVEAQLDADKAKLKAEQKEFEDEKAAAQPEEPEAPEAKKIIRRRKPK